MINSVTYQKVQNLLREYRRKGALLDSLDILEAISTLMPDPGYHIYDIGEESYIEDFLDHWIVDVTGQYAIQSDDPDVALLTDENQAELDEIVQCSKDAYQFHTENI